MSLGTVIRDWAAAASAVALLVGSTSAQSLGEVARQEELRRKTVSGSKVYTNESLPAVAPSTATAAPAASPGVAEQAQPDAQAAPSPAPDGQTPGASTADGTTKDEKYWRSRMDAARDGRSRAEVFADALQSRINSLSADFVNRDDPFQRNVIAGDRQKALAELDRVKIEILQATKEVADTQEEARRAGVPAAWVR